MMTIILGGSGSGKSAFAEEYLVRESEGLERYYLATMQVYGEEGKRKVARHRELRKNKGFQTIERPRGADLALESISDPSHASVLLECMSNLAANEMFTENGVRDVETVVKTIVSDVARLNEALGRLVVVTNNVFEDGILYEEETMHYLQALGEIHAALARMADEVIEVVVGIPVVLKKGGCYETV